MRITLHVEIDRSPARRGARATASVEPKTRRSADSSSSSSSGQQQQQAADTLVAAAASSGAAAVARSNQVAGHCTRTVGYRLPQPPQSSHAPRPHLFPRVKRRATTRTGTRYETGNQMNQFISRVVNYVANVSSVAGVPS